MGLLVPLLLQLTLPLDLGSSARDQAVAELSQKATSYEKAETLLHRKLVLDHLVSIQQQPFRYQNAPTLTSSGQPLLIHLWSVHCPPCLKEMPELVTLFSGLREDSSIRTILLTEDSLDTLEEYLTRAPASLPPADLYVAGAASHLRTTIQQAPLPLTLLVDGHMVIRHAFVGSINHRRNDLLSAIERLCSSLGAACRRAH